MGAVFKREMKAYFSSPLGYVILAVMILFSGIFFVYMYGFGFGDIGYIFSSQFTVIMFVVPVLTMRLFSEERKYKTDQALFTAPVGLYSVVLGKFFAAFALFAAGFLPTLIYELVLTSKITVNWLLYICYLLGVSLYSAALIAIGVFVSSLTESQVVAAVASLFVSIFIALMDSIAQMLEGTFLNKIFTSISFVGRYETFANGILDFSNILFFLSVTGLFIFFTVRTLERKRWA